MFPKRFLWNFTFSPFQENYFWDPPHLKCHSSRKSINLIMWWVFQNSKFMYCKKRMMLVFNMIFVLLCAAIQSNQIIYQGKRIPIYEDSWWSFRYIECIECRRHSNQICPSIHPSIHGRLSWGDISVMDDLSLWWIISLNFLKWFTKQLSTVQLFQ